MGALEVPEGYRWVPLGSAKIIDWKHLSRPGSAKGATAWLSKVGGEPVLLRSWSNEGTIFYEFYFLAYEELNGTLVISTSRPEDPKLRLKATLDVDGRLGYSDISEYQQHPQTGLLGSIVRTVEVSQGDIPTDRLAVPTAADAQIFEHSPDNALQTTCGTWIHSVLDCVRGQLLDGDEGVEAVAAPTPAPTPKKPKREGGRSRARATMDGPNPISAEPEPAPAPPPPQKKRGNDAAPAKRAKREEKLICTANSGEVWEIAGGDETFIGRSKQCGVVLKSQRVSRKHASVTQETDGFYINDLGAANGIWAGTEKIDRDRIEDGAEYIVGDVLITFNFS